VVDVLGREGTSTQAYDFNATGTTFMHYFMPAFAGWKGSTRLKVVPWGGPRTSNIYSTLAIGLTNSPQTASFGYQLIPAGSDYHTAASLWRRGQWINSSSGISLTQKLQKAGVEVEFPWQRSERMERTGLMWGRATSTYARAIISEDIMWTDHSIIVGWTFSQPQEKILLSSGGKVCPLCTVKTIFRRVGHWTRGGPLIPTMR
jgi:hypothetical protein